MTGEILLIILLVLYFLPSIIAMVNEKKNVAAIIALNLFGFTGICWIIALVWALCVDKK